MNNKCAFNKSSSDQGLTLIELVVAMLILSLFVITYATATTTSFNGYFTAGKKTVALNYARQKIETIKANPTKTTVNVSNVPLGAPGYTYSLSMAPYYGKVYAVYVSVYYPYPKSIDLFTLVY